MTEGTKWEWINGYIIDPLDYSSFWYINLPEYNSNVATQPDRTEVPMCARMSVHTEHFKYRMADHDCTSQYRPLCHHY